MTRAVFAALWSHWRRNPLQFLTLIGGIALATSLWSGVQAINAEARASYAAAADQVESGGRDTLRAGDGRKIALADYAALRRAGWRVTPVIEVALGGGVRLLGVDPLTSEAVRSVQIGDLTGGPFATGRAEALAALPPDLVVTRVADESAPAGLVITDISIAAQLSGDPSPSRLIILPQVRADLPPLAQVAPNLIRASPVGGTDLVRLTDSFHLNLTAFGLLSFAVGIFIVHSAIGLAFEQRRALVRTLRALGVPLARVLWVTGVEVLGFGLIGGALGVVLGYLVAAALLPDVAATLRGLYGAEVGGTLRIRPVWWVSGLGMAVAGTAMAAAGAMVKTARLPILAAARPRVWAMSARRGAVRQAAFAGGLFVVAMAALAAPPTLAGSFVLLGALLTGAALGLPALLLLLTALFQRRARGPLAQWFWADTRQQLPGLSLALMALLLALSANVGVSTMVSSFRLTFIGFLDQRLAAELYVDATAEGLKAWMLERADAVLPIQSVERTVAGQIANIYGTRNDPTYPDNWRLLDAMPEAWATLHTGAYAMINEQMARRGAIRVGDEITVEGQIFGVVGIFGDYGNPVGQVMIDEALWHRLFPDTPVRRYALRIAPEAVPALAADLRAAFPIPADAIIDQSALKALSLAIFDRTFVVTGALNVLTLLVAAFALWMSLLTLAGLRLPQLAPVWAMGVQSRTLARLELLRAIGLALLTGVLAVPLGLALAWVLLAVVNVEAFGWRLPMFLFPRQYLVLGAESLVAAGLAAAWPALKLARQPPARLLRVFSSER